MNGIPDDLEARFAAARKRYTDLIEGEYKTSAEWIAYYRGVAAARIEMADLYQEASPLRTGVVHAALHEARWVARADAAEMERRANEQEQAAEGGAS